VPAREARHSQDTANAAFDVAASQLEELGYLHEITSDGVVFSRAEPAGVEEYDPEARTAAAALWSSRPPA
jgi:hypothetical protein